MPLGSAEDLARLKTPDVELSAYLLDRAWHPFHWTDHAAMLRRILPQFASALVGGLITPHFGLEEAGHCLARGEWLQWPAGQATAVQEFLDAWWAYTLAVPDPAVPAYDVLGKAMTKKTGSVSWRPGCSPMPSPGFVSTAPTRTCCTGYG